MVQNPPRLNPEQRREIIKTYITQETQDKIAERCGVHRNTIVRDIRDMKESGEWDEWIEKEFLRLHKHPEIKPHVKYVQIAILYGRTKTQKIETSMKGPASIVLSFDKTMEIKPKDEPDP